MQTYFFNCIIALVLTLKISYAQLQQCAWTEWSSWDCVIHCGDVKKGLKSKHNTHYLIIFNFAQKFEFKFPHLNF